MGLWEAIAASSKRFRRKGLKLKALVRMSGILVKEESSIGLGPKLRAGSQPMMKLPVKAEVVPIHGLRPDQTAFEQMMNAESKFC